MLRRPIRRVRAIVALAFALCLCAATAPAGRTAVTCRGAVEHPVSVRVETLDPVRRGASVRLRVNVTSEVGLSRAQARLVHSGRAQVVGQARVALGSLKKRTPSEAEFRVVVPANGERALIQIKVEGEGPNGLLTRGAAVNLLPDGPTQIGRAATAGDGSKLVEFAARRITP